MPENYVFESSRGAVRLSQLFGNKDTLVIYSMMLGPDSERQWGAMTLCGCHACSLPSSKD
ncbi:MAG: DUF899 family protein [Acidobacteriaceae bacterium]